MKDKRKYVTRRQPTKGVRKGRPYLRPPKNSTLLQRFGGWIIRVFIE